MPTTLALTVLGLPFVSFLVLALARPVRRAGRAAGWLSIAAMACAFLAALAMWTSGMSVEALWSWVPADEEPMVTVGVLVDELSRAMLLVQVYSLAYLHEEPPPSLGRYYAYQSLFAFSMLGLVLAPTFVQMFVFWELVGLCSYLLIGYWYDRPSAARAAVK